MRSWQNNRYPEILLQLKAYDFGTILLFLAPNSWAKPEDKIYYLIFFHSLSNNN